MLGTNERLKPENHDGSVLKVQEIFATFQGEGPYVGHPAVFIRLGGCNLACKFCDTEFESYSSVNLEDIIAKTLKLSLSDTETERQCGDMSDKDNKEDDGKLKFSGKRVRNLVVITGGEPLRQPIIPLCEKLIENGFKVQIETNGTLYRKLPDEVEIVCSPKTSGGQYQPIRNDLLQRLGAIKFIISAHNAKYSDIAEVGQSQYDIAVYLQPMDEMDETKNKRNLQKTMQLAEKYGYNISLQIHKILEID